MKLSTNWLLFFVVTALFIFPLAYNLIDMNKSRSVVCADLTYDEIK